VLAFQSPTSLQLTFQVTSDVVQAEAMNDAASNNLLISLRTLSIAEKDALKKKKQDTIKQQMTNNRNRWKLDVIVIDAGHGGKDPGCIGVVGTREKNITLGVALKLGHLIESSLKGVKVVYTRSSDKFVELYKRTQIANEAGGKLFVSIHCNSLPHKPSRMNGFEIYLLRPGRTEEAVAIASRENSVIQLEEDKERYKKLTEEEFIIVTMAQSAYVKQSEQFAESAASSMAKRLRLRNSGVKQAGFFVLVGASMPNVLVELGYLSNRSEEQFLRSENGQERIADAIFRGIKEYKIKYEQSLQEGIEEH
jgi:N-acetylmuramoyl-L-alanine amidase